MKLEEAKKLLKEMQENCIKGMIRGIIYTDEKAEQKSVAIDTVLQALEELQQKEKSRIIGNINEIKIKDLEPILKPYYISKEKVLEKMKKLDDLANDPKQEYYYANYRYTMNALEDLLGEDSSNTVTEIFRSKARLAPVEIGNNTKNI